MARPRSPRRASADPSGHAGSPAASMSQRDTPGVRPRTWRNGTRADCEMRGKRARRAAVRTRPVAWLGDTPVRDDPAALGSADPKRVTDAADGVDQARSAV